MYVLRRRTRIEIWTPAKLNLFLEVLSRRDDGYHEIETLMTPVSLYDTLRIRLSDDRRIDLQCRWAAAGSDCLLWGDLPAPEMNLVYRAVVLLRQRSGEQRGLSVRLLKRIPSASGLGGGSSDAAAALVGANLVWGLHWSPDRLASLAGELGSDVPFFLAGGAAVCRGRGECVEPVWAGPPRSIVLVRPPQGLSTAAIYGRTAVPADPRRVDRLLMGLQTGSAERSSAGWFNRLQAAAFETAPELELVRKEFARLDVGVHQLSGSGSGYFGVCRNVRHAQRVASSLRARRVGSIFRVVTLPTWRSARQYASPN
jgi:4-diphosphocytidyl-2-C-methyl-D-erythritol kinase